MEEEKDAGLLGTTLPSNFRLELKYMMDIVCVFNRPGVAGAVLQTPPSLIH